MNIKYKFMENGLTQNTLSAMIEKKLKRKDISLRCTQCDVSNTLSKANCCARLTEKEQIIYNIMLDILKELEDGKTKKENH